MLQVLLDRQTENGGPFWSREDGNIHAPAGFCTIDILATIGDMGVTPDADTHLTEAVEFLFTYQNEDGSFSYAKRKSKLPCITAQVLVAMGRLGVANDKRLDKSFTWLASKQGPDGGWRCATVKLGSSPETDASNPGTTLYALDAMRFAKTPLPQASVKGAIDFLLGHWQTRAPLGPCTFGIGSRFLQVEYPFLRYNLFYYVFVLSHFAHAQTDKRFVEALAQLAEHTSKGEMIIDSPHRAWAKTGWVSKAKPNDLATQKWQLILDNTKN